MKNNSNRIYELILFLSIFFTFVGLAIWLMSNGHPYGGGFIIFCLLCGNGSIYTKEEKEK